MSQIEIDKLCLKPEATLYDALQVINSQSENSTKIVLVVDECQSLIGVVNDGDIRRALLMHRSLDLKISSFMKIQFIYAKQGTSRSIVLDKMRSLCVDQIPVVDEEMKVVGLHLLRELISKERLKNAVVIMAGGKGTRLRPITENIPKPMVNVAGRPILEHIIHHLTGNGLRDIYLSVNYKSEIIQDYFKDGADFGCEIKYLKEDKPLGTAGALSLLPTQKSNVILMNGDLITQFNVGLILESHFLRENSITVGARDHVTCIPYGVLKLDESSHRVTCINEKPEIHNIVNGGVYVISPELLSLVPSNELYNATDLIEECFRAKKQVGYHLLEEEWIDIGEHSALTEARGQ